MSGGVKEVSAAYRGGELLDGCPVGYKRTEVGVIPDDWDVCTINDIASVKGGKRLPKGERLLKTPTKHPYIRVADMYMGGVDLSDIHYVPEDISHFIRRYRINAEDIFISVAGTLGIIGKIPEVLDGANLTENADKITDIKACRDYLLFCLMSERIQNDIASQGTIGAQPKLALGRIEKFLVALPRLITEQTAIANALSDVDALITSLETLITKKRAIKTAAMQQLLTGKKRLPPYDKTHTGYKQTELGEIPEDWEVRELGSIGTFTKGAGVKKDESNSGNIPCVRYGEIYTKHNDYIKTFSSYISESVSLTATKLFKGDLLFAGSGETKEEIGKCVAFVDDIEAYAGGDIVILRPQSVNSLYLGYCLNSEYVVKQKSSKGQGDAVVHISANALRGVQVMLPRSEIEQQSIASVLFDMDEEINFLGRRLTKTQHIKQGMMQELLTGRTRLI